MLLSFAAGRSWLVHVGDLLTSTRPFTVISLMQSVDTIQSEWFVSLWQASWQLWCLDSVVLCAEQGLH
jgi:hypothetical protein